MTLTELLTKAIHSRQACNWRMRSKKPSPDCFQASIGRLQQFITSYPKGGQQATKLFFSGILYRDFLHVLPGNKAGETMKEKLMELRNKS